MRAIKAEQINKRVRKSSFIEYFTNRYGPTSTERANERELNDKLNKFYMDIVYGNFVDSDIERLEADRRIIQLAIDDCTRKVNKNFILMTSLNLLASNGSPYINLSEYQELVDEVHNKYYTYSIIFKGLNDYIITGNPGFLVSLSAQFNSKGTSPMKRML